MNLELTSYTLQPQYPRRVLPHHLPPITLRDRLERNEVPRWLVKIAEEPVSGYALYRIAD